MNNNTSKILVIGDSCKDNPVTIQMIEKEKLEHGIDNVTIVHVADFGKTTHQITEQVREQLKLITLTKEVKDNTKFILGVNLEPDITHELKCLDKFEDIPFLPKQSTPPPIASREHRYNKKRNGIYVPKSSRGYVLGGGINKLSGERSMLNEFKDAKGQKFIRKPSGSIVRVDKFPSEAVKEFNSRNDIKQGKDSFIPPQVVV